MIALLFSLALASNAYAETPSRGVVQLQTDDRIHFIWVEVADEPNEHSRGLMFRDTLPKANGMLFVYPRAQRTAFWMKNTKIPLDMLFIDEEGEIIKIEAETTPYSLEPVSSGGEVIGVLEIKGGEADRLGIEVGDTASWLEFP